MSSFTGRGGRGDSGGRCRGDGGRGGGRGGDSYSGGRGDGGRGRGDSGGGRGRGGDFGGGRGRGDFDGGRGGGGRGSGNPHLGECGSMNMLNDRVTGMRDSDILAVINPSPADRVRSALITTPHLPSRIRDRTGAAIGVNYTPGGAVTVTSNHFIVQGPQIPIHTITHYHIHLYRIGSDNQNRSEDISPTEDCRKTVQIMKTLQDKHPEWNQPSPIGFAYDYKSALFTTRALPFTTMNEDGQFSHNEIIGLPNSDGTESTTLRYRVVLTEAGRNLLGFDKLRAQEIAVLMFGRWNVMLDAPTWTVVNKSIYGGSDDPRCIEVKPLTSSGHVIAKQGWFASLKPCLAGPMLIVDLACCAFLSSGNMIELMAKTVEARSVADFIKMCSDARGLDGRSKRTIETCISKLKVKVTHLGFWKVVRHLGPAANDRNAAFEHDGKKYTVAEYYALKSKTDKRYKPLKYPTLPTVNMGSKTRPELYPIELVDVPSGQARNRMLTEDPRLVAEMIKYAAVKPAERMAHIVNNANSVVKTIQNDPTAQAFGLSGVSATPSTVPATILPQAKLQYGAGQVVDPGFKGTWSADFPKKVPFYRPPAAGQGKCTYGIVLVGDAPPRGDWKGTLENFLVSLEADSKSVGVNLVRGGPALSCRPQEGLLHDCFEKMKRGGARIVFVVMVADGFYGLIKLVGDAMPVPTQCIKWAKLEKSPRGIHYNIILKMNFKMGGTSHVLKSRLAAPQATAAATAGHFQSPPASLSWVFDKPCMLVGIDVSHPEPGSTNESMAAVVGSVDGTATKYVAHISAQTSRQEMVGGLTDAMNCLFTSFRSRNKGSMPSTVIVYRDGVSEGQYDAVLQTELPQIKSAIELQGFSTESVNIVVVVCTKGHRTRLVCQEGAGGAYINPCPGLVVDSTITSETLNEFYLNSHAAIQGTSKPCRYTLLYDELGFKMSELQLLTYWTTYLYARCNKTVSYATPAYYAHWASKRGKDLLAAGANPEKLQHISATCANVNSSYNMFFI